MTKRTTLIARLKRLEVGPNDAGRLPTVVADETTDAEMAELRRHGEAYRFSEFVELAVVETEHERSP